MKGLTANDVALTLSAVFFLWQYFDLRLRGMLGISGCLLVPPAFQVTGLYQISPAFYVLSFATVLPLLSALYYTYEEHKRMEAEKGIEIPLVTTKTRVVMLVLSSVYIGTKLFYFDRP